MKVDNIKNYLSEELKEDFIKIIDEVYSITEHLNETYPGYRDWFFEKQVKGCYTPNRNILFIKNDDGEIIALSCLKKDEEEKKICTLFVNPNYRKHGIGSLLFEESMKFLETTKPLVTFTEDKLPMFEKIVSKYNWELTEIVDGIYNDGVRELCFNGQLSKRDYKQELLQLLKNLKKVASNTIDPTDTLNKIAVSK